MSKNKLIKIRDYIISYLYERMKNEKDYLQLEYDSAVRLISSLKVLDSIIDSDASDERVNIFFEKIADTIDLTYLKDENGESA